MKVPANGALPSGWSNTRLRPIATIVPEGFVIAAPTPAEPERYDAHASSNATRQLSSSEAHALAASSTAPSYSGAAPSLGSCTSAAPVLVTERYAASTSACAASASEKVGDAGCFSRTDRTNARAAG